MVQVTLAKILALQVRMRLRWAMMSTSGRRSIGARYLRMTHAIAAKEVEQSDRRRLVNREKTLMQDRIHRSLRDLV
jgi:hypothetical protein